MIVALDHIAIAVPDLEKAIKETPVAKVKPGEIYQLGKHLLLVDDSTNENAVKKLIQAKQDLFTAQGLPGKRKAWFQLYRALSQLAQAEFTWMRNDTNFAFGQFI